MTGYLEIDRRVDGLACPSKLMMGDPYDSPYDDYYQLPRGSSSQGPATFSARRRLKDSPSDRGEKFDVSKEKD